MLTSEVMAQITFEKIYGGINRDEGYSIQQTPDGGYIIAGFTYSFGAGLSDVYLIKTDSLGNTSWTKTLGDSSWEGSRSVQVTTDGGFIIAGYTSSVGAGLGDVYLVKTDSTGDTLWTKTYGGISNDIGYSVQQTFDGGYIITGRTASFGAGFYDVYLIRTDSLGDTLWTKTYGRAAWDEGSSVQQTSDGGFIVTGLADEVWAGSWLGEVYLIKTDSLGDSLWTKTFGDSYYNRGYSVQETSDTGFIITGVYGRAPQFSSVYLINTDSQGDTLWTRTYDGGIAGYSVKETSDGGYIISGLTWTNVGGYDVYLIKTDSLGDSLWTRTYGCMNRDYGWSVQETSDGGFIIGGYTYSIGAGSTDVYLIKTDGNGLVVRDIGTVILDAPGDTVFTDSTYPVAATVQNFGKSYLTFDVIATIDGYSDTAQVSCLHPDSSTQVNFSNWQVPSNDSTIYTMTVCIDVAFDVDTTNDCMSKTIFAYTPVGIEEKNENLAPNFEFRLYQNKPNPFHKLTAISYQLGTDSHVSLKIFDITGKLVKTLVDEPRETGIYNVEWEGFDDTGLKAPSGIYFFRLSTSTGFNQTRKLLLIR
jgi:hypothetical protein